MAIAIISDAHSNLDALEAVLKDIERRKVEAIHFVGDAVGYGAEPSETLSRIKESCSSLLAGNHDRAAADLTEARYFNIYARQAIEWTHNAIDKAEVEYLRDLPLDGAFDDVHLVHATPWEPEMWHYLITLEDAERSFGHFSGRICFIGHSHSPLVIEKSVSGALETNRKAAEFKDGSRYIVNSGSIGQPRDGDPRACYALMDDSGVTIVRVPYNIESAQKKMAKAGLPVPLIERLSHGT